MDLLKVYKNTDGKNCNILQMIRTEPEWAANIIQYYEKEKQDQKIREHIDNVLSDIPSIEVLKILKKYNRLRNDWDAYLLELIKYGLGEGSKPNLKDYGF